MIFYKAICPTIMKCLFPAVICFSLLLSLTAPAIAVEYEYIGIPTPSWWKSVFPLDINDNGTVVGRVGLELPPIGRFPKPSLHIEKGFIYNGNNYTELLPTLLLPRYRIADAASVNNSGVVVGSVATLIPFYPLANFYEIFRRGFIYFGGIYIELLPPGWSEAYADYITDNGKIFGYGKEWFRNDTKRFLYHQLYYTILQPPEWESAYVYDINKNGDVAGEGFDATDKKRKGFIFSDGQYTELLPPGWESAEADCINNNRAVVGQGAELNSTTIKGFIYKDNKYTIFNLPQWWQLRLLDFNDSETIVATGFYNDENCPGGSLPPCSYKAFLYKEGTTIELLPPGWQGVIEVFINNSDVVVGTGYDGNAKKKVFVYSNGDYTELLPPGWQDASTEYIGYSGKSPIKNNGTVAAWGHDAYGKQKAFIAVPK